MPETVPPNPPSPFADADPALRHILPTLFLLPDPAPGALVLTGCMRMAVVPDGPMRETSATAELPDGLCPACIAAMRGEELPEDTRPITGCRTCDNHTEHDGVCALCRQEMHEQWIAAGRPDGVTLEQSVLDILQADAIAEHLDQIEGISYAGTGDPGITGQQQANQ